MKKAYRFLLVVIGMSVIFHCSAQERPDTSLAYWKIPLKYLEFGVKYSQLDRGFFQGQFSIFREVNDTYIGYTQHEIAAGYSLWKHAFNIETNHRFVLVVLSVGGGVGYCSSSDFTRSQFYFKPEVGFNLFYAQVYYTYSFATTNDAILTNTESNLTLSFPIRSTFRFKKWNLPKRWHWWGTYVGMEDKRDYDPQYGGVMK